MKHVKNHSEMTRIEKKEYRISTIVHYIKE